MKREPGYYKVRHSDGRWSVAQLGENGRWSIDGGLSCVYDSYTYFTAIGDRIPMPDDEPQKSDIGPDPEPPPITLDDLRRVAKALSVKGVTYFNFNDDDVMIIVSSNEKYEEIYTDEPHLRKVLEFLDEPPRRTVMEVLRGVK